MTPIQVLWIFVVLLVAGGVMGYVKAGSKASLIASVGFAIPLILCAMEVITEPMVADVLLLVLLAVFARRFAKSKRIMPAGLMCILSVVALAARYFLK